MHACCGGGGGGCGSERTGVPEPRDLAEGEALRVVQQRLRVGDRHLLVRHPAHRERQPHDLGRPARLEAEELGHRLAAAATAAGAGRRWVVGRAGLEEQHVRERIGHAEVSPPAATSEPVTDAHLHTYRFIHAAARAYE